MSGIIRYSSCLSLNRLMQASTLFFFWCCKRDEFDSSKAASAVRALPKDPYRIGGWGGKRALFQRSRLEFSSGRGASVEPTTLVCWSNHRFQTLSWRAERCARQ